MTKCLLMKGVHLWEVSVSGGSTVIHVALYNALYDIRIHVILRQYMYSCRTCMLCEGEGGR